MAELLAAGHSRVPVFDGERRNVRGLLLVKRLIVLDPEDARPIASLPLRPVVFVGPSAPLFGMLNQFQTGSAAAAPRRRRHHWPPP